jgi:hypothetical protein
MFVPEAVGAATTATTPVTPYSGIGYITLNATTFTITAWAYQNGTVQTANTSGTYTMGSNCSLQLTIPASSGGSPTPTAFSPPATLSGILVSPTSGLVSLQTSGSGVITGPLIAQ